MAVRRLKNGKWQADVTVGVKWDGARDRRTRVCRTKKEAQAAERAFLIERDGRRGISGRITFREFVDTLWWPQKAGLRRNSRDTYRQVLNRRLMPAFGDMDLERINRMSVQKMILSCPTRKSAQKAREVLSSVLGNAVEMGMIAVNPASFRYQYPKKGDGGRQGEWLTTFAQHRRLLGYLRESCPGTAEERMVVLGLCLGLRKGEIFGLDWEDVDLARGTVAIRRTYTVGEGGAALDDPKTERSERTIPLTSWAAARMEAWGPSSGPIVTGRDGGRMNPNTAGKHMRRLVEGCYDDGEPIPRVTLYTLRHSFATACIGEGIEVAKVSRWLGHCDVSTTYNRYVRPMLGDLEVETSVIDAAMGDV
ncbi:tyrosine-type recombinase/integrase [Enorma phocaeensis]|uniref:tyrosine-type recombinase/integrase n=1 Tax=Enorma phocaeensis TaxID=1871019 RepID=UPI0032099E7A